jgi:hypothetical protein
MRISFIYFFQFYFNFVFTEKKFFLKKVKTIKISIQNNSEINQLQDK